MRKVPKPLPVTPCMGVWIEIDYGIYWQKIKPSLPVWECGLKSCRRIEKPWRWICHSLYGSVDWNCFPATLKSWQGVTPCMGVWIEIAWKPGKGNLCSVTPCMGVWIEIERLHNFHGWIKSLPVWECGLKSIYHRKQLRPRCHSLYGSVDWNPFRKEVERVISCHSLYGSVDWNDDEKSASLMHQRHSLYGSVDWNKAFRFGRPAVPGHSLYGSVDWNLMCVKIFQRVILVTPCMGVWIEIYWKIRHVRQRDVTPCMGVWIEIGWISTHGLTPSVTPCMGVWIEIALSWKLKKWYGSLPVWECGLKFLMFLQHVSDI